MLSWKRATSTPGNRMNTPSREKTMYACGHTAAAQNTVHAHLKTSRRAFVLL